MVSKIIIFLATPLLGINFLIPNVIFAAEEIPTPTPFQSYSQKIHSILLNSGSNTLKAPSASATGLSNVAAFDALGRATAPASTMVNSILQLFKQFNYSSLKLGSGNIDAQTNLGDESRKALSGVRNIKSNLSGQGALLSIENIFIFVLKLFVVILDIVSQIVKGVLGLFG